MVFDYDNLFLARVFMTMLVVASFHTAFLMNAITRALLSQPLVIIKYLPYSGISRNNGVHIMSMPRYTKHYLTIIFCIEIF